uniref:Uncharacterized protein n=1 Tax=Setaria viridis TaxID=4556 RepID=A0A4U6UFA7_SETVI|nr:hypothetical protein SEVIR_5G179032v2 [Setaria viridis]
MITNPSPKTRRRSLLCSRSHANPTIFQATDLLGPVWVLCEILHL